MMTVEVANFVKWFEKCCYNSRFLYFQDTTKLTRVHLVFLTPMITFDFNT